VRTSRAEHNNRTSTALRKQSPSEETWFSMRQLLVLQHSRFYCACSLQLSEWLGVVAGMWSRSRHLSLETVSRRTNVSSQSHLGQNSQCLRLILILDQCICLGLGAICLGLGPVGLVSGLGPLRLVETFCAGVCHTYCSCS